jgi:hypothetical protein
MITQFLLNFDQVNLVLKDREKREEERVRPAAGRRTKMRYQKGGVRRNLPARVACKAVPVVSRDRELGLLAQPHGQTALNKTGRTSEEENTMNKTEARRANLVPAADDLA